MPNYGRCRVCDAPLVRLPNVKVGRDEWGLTYWRAGDLSCGRVQENFGQSLACYFNATGGLDRAMSEPSPFLDKVKSSSGAWQGGRLVVPFKGGGK